MTPEDLIQAAWVQRAATEKAARQAKGLAAHEMHCEPWMPEVAVQALRDAGWTPPKCGCDPDPISGLGIRREAGICGVAQPLTKDECTTFDAMTGQLKEMSALEQAMRDAADRGEWPEMGA